jgi:HK97 family phage major capsid protein
MELPEIFRAPASTRKDWKLGDYVRAIRAEKGVDVRRGADGDFATLGCNLQAVAAYGNSRGACMDSRLVRAPLGQGEIDPSGGGFLVGTDHATAMLMRIYDNGQLWNATTGFTVSATSNGTSIPAIDETSRADGQRFGGVSVYMTAEGNAPTASATKVRKVDLNLKKMAGLVYVSDEMLNDAPQITQLVNTALLQEFAYTLDNFVVRGNGGSQPLGILNAPCKVKVAAETGQKTKTIVLENILNMESRMWGPSMANANWYVNSDVLPSLRQMSLAIGTGGVPAYMPPGGLSSAPYGMLLGRPVLPIEQCSTLGTEGDIILADPSQFLRAEKGGLQVASSMHVQFLTDQMAFRFTMRIDGQPWWHTALTPANGTVTKSPFVTLANR